MMMYLDPALAIQPVEHEPTADCMGEDERATFGRNVKAARSDKGWTQRQLADAVGIKQGSISKIETGSLDMTIDLMARIARALDTDLHKLMSP